MKTHPNGEYDNALLIMCGSTRNQEDEQLVQNLVQYIEKQKLHRHIHIYTNLSYDLLLYVMRQSHIGIHTMWNEHFGISVVEMMAMGLVVIAHNSGGPKADIISDTCTGTLRKWRYCVELIDLLLCFSAVLCSAPSLSLSPSFFTLIRFSSIQCK